MTTGRRGRVSDIDLEERIRGLLRGDATRSTREVGRILRQQGIRASHARVRSFSRAIRIEFTTGVGRNTAFLRAGGAFGREGRTSLVRAITQEAVSRLPTHVAIDAMVRASVRVSFYGQVVFDGIWEQPLGRFVTTTLNFNEAIVQGNAASRIEGEIIRRYAQGTSSYIEGLDIEIRDMDIVVVDVEQRR